jgi:hypothetical protein
LITPVADGAVEGAQQTDLAIYLPQQRQPAVAGDVATFEISDDLTTTKTGKQEGLCGTVCHADGLPFLR